MKVEIVRCARCCEVLYPTAPHVERSCSCGAVRVRGRIIKQDKSGMLEAYLLTVGGDVNFFDLGNFTDQPETIARLELGIL